MTASSLAGSTVTNTMTYTYFGDGTRVGARVSNHAAAGYSGMRYGISSDDHLGTVSKSVSVSVAFPNKHPAKYILFLARGTKLSVSSRTRYKKIGG